MNLVRDKETGKSKGFAFLKYEDQRSTDLAVDNLGGATVLGRVLKVDHTRYKKKDDEDVGDNTVSSGMGKEDAYGKPDRNEARKRRKSEQASEDEDRKRPQLKEERELEALIRDHDEDDPMKEYLIQEKKDELSQALARLKEKDGKTSDGKKKHHHRHRSRKEDDRRDRSEERYRKHRHHRH